MAHEFAEMPTRDGMYLRDAIGGEIRDVDDSNHTVMAVFPHDTVDTFKTTFDKDAFRDSFERRSPLMCWQHDLRDPIGHSVRAQVLPTHNEIVGKFDDFDAVPNAKRAFHQIQSGTITDFSFGFRQPKYEPHPRHRGVRNIRSAVMLEFSPVSVGSIPGAIATSIRSEEEEQFMSEHSAAEIAALVQAEVITADEGKLMLAELDGWRDHITIISPEQKRIAELEAELNKRDAVVTEPTVITPPEPEEYKVPEALAAEDIVNALPVELQRALAEQKAVVAIGPEGSRVVTGELEVNESAALIASAVRAAQASALDWIKDVDRRELPNEVQQALLLVDAAATSTDALLDVLGLREIPGSPSGPRGKHVEPANPPGTENMGLHKVNCLTCAGTGKTEDGKSCPDCDGTGIVAVTREGEEAAATDADAVASEGMDYRFVSAADRKEMAKKGVAMSNGDFPIPDKDHLQSALGHWSTYTGDKAEAKAHIKKRAKALGVTLSDDALDGDTREANSHTSTHADGPDLPDGDGDSDDGTNPDAERIRRKQQAAMAKLGRHSSKDEKTSVDRKGSEPGLTKTSDEGMNSPMNHTPGA